MPTRKCAYPPTHSSPNVPQDGYTLERVDVYGLVDGVHETVVISSAECYVARNDNPSFSASPPLLSIPSTNARRKLARNHLERSRMLSGMPWALQGRTRYDQRDVQG
jgi:hypothetical protein